MEFLREKSDFFTSVEKALDEIDSKWREYPGLIVAGSHDPERVEEKIEKIRWARENNIPFLGICLGMQLMIIEFARNVLGKVGADSTEIHPQTPFPVVTKLPELRVGIRPVVWESRHSMESHWHNYAFNSEKYRTEFDKHFIASYTEKVAEVMKLRNHKFFVGVQFHPEYGSDRGQPHPILKEFIKVCKVKKDEK